MKAWRENWKSCTGVGIALPARPTSWEFGPFFLEDVPRAVEQHPPSLGEHFALGTSLLINSDLPVKPVLLEVEPDWLRISSKRTNEQELIWCLAFILLLNSYTKSKCLILTA